MSLSQFHFALAHAWLNLLDKHMTTGRINQVASRLRAFFALESAAIAAESKTVGLAPESPSPRRSLLHSSRRIGDGRPRRLRTARFPGRIGRHPRPDSPSQNWSGVRRNAPVKAARVCGLSADRGPLAQAMVKHLPIEDLFPRAVGKRPADRGSFSSGRGEETCRSRIFFPRPWGRDLPIEDLFPRAVGKRPADRGTFPPGESLKKLSFSSWTVPAL